MTQNEAIFTALKEEGVTVQVYGDMEFVPTLPFRLCSAPDLDERIVFHIDPRSCGSLNFVCLHCGTCDGPDA